MKSAVRASLPALIAACLWAPYGWGQESPQDPGKPKQEMFVTVDEKEAYVVQGDQQLDIKSGETVRVTPDGMQFTDRPPSALNWPCGSAFADGYGTNPSYPLSELGPNDPIGQVVQRFFDTGAAPAPLGRWMNGDAHMSVPASEVDAFVSEASWFKAGPPDHPLAAQKPETVQIMLFRSTGQVVVDTAALAKFKAENPGQDVPLFFNFASSSEVPISWYGENPTLDQIFQTYKERGARPAPPPAPWAGDRLLDMPPGALADALGVPPASAMNPDELAAAEADLKANGFGTKPIGVTVPAGGDSMLTSDGVRLRAAANLGMASVPMSLNIFSPSAAAEHCGVPPAVGAVGILGLTVTDNKNPAGDGDGPTGPENPIIPPEVLPPDVPPVEPPASGN